MWWVLIKLVIFDLDQTLIDTIHRFHEVFNRVLGMFGGVGVSWDEFIAAYSSDTLNDYIPKSCDEKEFWREFRRVYSSFIHDLDKPIDGVEEVLKFLKDMGLKVVVCTGRECSSEDVVRELRHFNLIRYIDGVYTLMHQDPSEEDVVFCRSGLLKRILDDYGVRVDEALFVGDYWVDMYSAKKVGLKCIGVLTGYEPTNRLMKFGADYIIRSVADLPDIIKSLT